MVAPKAFRNPGRPLARLYWARYIVAQRGCVAHHSGAKESRRGLSGKRAAAARPSRSVPELLRTVCPV